MTFDPDAPAKPGSGIYGLAFAPADAAVVLMPVPFEATTSYGGGAAGGPEAILEASRQVDLFDIETGRPYSHGISMLPASEDILGWNREAKHSARPVIDVGGVVQGRPDLIAALERVNELGSLVNTAVLHEARSWLERGKIFGVIGGDHSAPFGAIQAHAERWPGLGILHIDAHADLRRAYEGFTWSHASIMHNVVSLLPGVARLVQVGIRDLGADELKQIRDSGGRIRTHFDATLATGQLLGRSWGEQCARIIEQLPDNVYVSMDIDGLDPTLCPSTGTPVPGGLSFHQFGLLMRILVQSGRKILGFDLDEVASSPRAGEWDGNVAARVLYKLIGWTLVSRGLEVPPELPGAVAE